MIFVSVKSMNFATDGTWIEYLEYIKGFVELSQIARA